jgi:hypothetical protein
LFRRDVGTLALLFHFRFIYFWPTRPTSSAHLVLVEPSATRVVGLRHHPGWSEDLLAEAAAAVCRAGLFDAEAGVGALAHADRALSLRYTTGTIARTARPTKATTTSGVSTLAGEELRCDQTRCPGQRRRCCQSNADRSPKRLEPEISGRQLTPLGQSDRAFLLEDVTAVEAAVPIKGEADLPCSLPSAHYPETAMRRPSWPA